MESLVLSDAFLWAELTASFLLLLFLSLCAIVGRHPSENNMRRAIGTLSIACVTFAVVVAVQIFVNDAPMRVEFKGSPLYFVDSASSVLMVAAALIIAIVGNFSLTYLHLDPGFQRYFFAFAMFFFGILQVFSAVNAPLFLAGWEFVGISSAMLIAFFQQRTEPVSNSRLAFGFFRIGDVGLFTGLTVICHVSASGLVPWMTPGLPQDSLPLTFALIGVAVAAAVKMSLLPFVSWLPRAMEGPTPSSAVYYGALSVHAGAFLLWRMGPQLLGISGAGVFLVILGIATSLYAAWCGRIRPDVKTQLAFGSMAQLGLICVEIGFGWQSLAIWHIVGHMCFRTLQFLSAPSALHTFRLLNIARASSSAGFHLEKLLPPSFQTRIYRLGLAELHVSDLLRSLVLQPLGSLAESFLYFDRRLLANLRFMLDRGSEGRSSGVRDEQVPSPQSASDKLRMELP